MQEPVPKRDLAGGDDLPGDVAAPENLSALSRETILLIHGTFANKAVSARAWWLPESEFCQKLHSYLSQRGSAARCWSGFGTQNGVFAWTGDNLEPERRIGGDSLAKEITDLEASPDIGCYHIVAHSHGGNVVLHALRSLADNPKKLGAVIFLGTPVLRFSRLPPWLDRSSVTMLFYGICLVGICGLYVWDMAVGLNGGASFLPIKVAIGTVIAYAIGFGLLLLDEWRNRLQGRFLIYGTGHAHAFEFTSDEAMDALRLAMQVAQRTKDSEATVQLKGAFRICD